MSTEDDRPRSAGGYSDSGLFTPGSSPYSSSGGAQDDNSSGTYDSGYSDAPTTVLPGTTTSFDEPYEEERVERPKPGWHAGADLGLLVLRLVIGGLFVIHGVRTLFGWFGGGGIGAAEETMRGFGFSNPTVMAWLTGVTELTGGTLVFLGLFTPAGAAAILGVMANVIIIKIDGDLPFGGVELEASYAAAAFALLFAGPGRISLDRPTPWYRNAGAFGVVFFLIAAAATTVTLTVFR